MSSKKRKKKLKIRPFRLLAVALGCTALMLLARFPQKAVSLERQEAQRAAAAKAYHDAQSEKNQLRAELDTVNSDDFIERMARRMYGYCWYGETIYEVGNLEQIQEETGFEVYGQE